MRESELSLTEVDGPDLGKDGRWYRVNTDDDGPTVFVRVHSDSAARPQVTGLFTEASRALTTRELYRVPLGAIERSLDPETSVLKSRDGEVTLEQPGPVRRKLDGEDAVGFAHRVARAYRWHSAQSAAPAKAMAEEAGIPAGTVRRWINEARELGALPPGRRGKAG